MSNSAIKSVVHAFATALASIDNTGSAVTNVCNAARAAYKGEAIPDDAMKSIVSDIADARGWKPRSVTRKVRESECRAILETYSVLPEATKKLDAPTFSYHDALKLARCLRKADSNVVKAVAAFKRKPSSTKAKPVPKDRAAKWLGKMFETASPAKRAKILQACALLGISIKQADADDSDDE